MLLDKGAIIDNEKKLGNTALVDACNKGQLLTVKFLVDNKANLNSKDRVGRTPLYQAATAGRLDMMKILIENGSDVNTSTNNSNITPLHIAVETGQSQIVKYLIANGAYVNITDIAGVTPFHLACGKLNMEIVNLMIENGAKINAKTKALYTPLHYVLYWEDNYDDADVYIIDRIDRAINEPKKCSFDSLSSIKLKMAKLLIAHNADLYAVTSRGESILAVAKSEMMKILIITEMMKQDEKLRLTKEKLHGYYQLNSQLSFLIALQRH